MKKISDIPILVAKPKLENSKIKGLKSFSKGYVKEGAGAGGCMIAAMLKTGRNADELLDLTEKEYQRVITSQ
jgi:NaMN:DMB phosphoribosyltransferase